MPHIPGHVGAIEAEQETGDVYRDTLRRIRNGKINRRQLLRTLPLVSGPQRNHLLEVAQQHGITLNDSGNTLDDVTQPGLGTGNVTINVNGGGGGGGVTREGLSRGELRVGIGNAGFSDLGPWVNEYINEAVRRKRGIAWAIGRIIADERFQRRYPGAVDENGVLVLSPAEWLNRSSQFRDIANQYGIPLGRERIGALIRGNKSPNEFAFQAKAIAVIKANPQAFSALNDILRQRGLKPLEGLGDVFDFVTNRKPAKFYEIYEATQFLSAARAAGLPLTARRAGALARGTPGLLSEQDIEEGFAEIAQAVEQGGVDLREFGLTQRDLQTIKFGGKNREKLSRRAAQALAQASARGRTQLVGQRLALTEEGRPVVGPQVFEDSL